MSVGLKTRVEFARKHWSAPGGQPFEIDEDGWLYSEYWKPLHSYRLWPINKSHICKACRGLAARLTEKYTRPKCHARRKVKSCRGLTCEPIQFVFLQLPRQSGKTVGTSGYVAASLFKGYNESIAFIAGSEDQSESLYEVHYKQPITRRKALHKHCKVMRTTITVPKRGNSFEFVATSLSGTTGGSKSLVIIDEARAVPAAVAAAFFPTIFAQNGWECPTRERGHTRTKGDLDSPNPQRTDCSVCGADLQPWVGRVLIMSSAQELTGSDKDWFDEVVTANAEDPQPRVHCYQATGVINKKVERKTVDQMKRVFGASDKMRSIIEIETDNTSLRRGTEFLSSAEIAATVDRKLRNQEAGERPSVGYLDLSRTGDLTSLVVCEDWTDLEGDAKPWHMLATVRIDIWDPKQQPNGIIDERIIEDHLDTYVPLFGLVELRMDERGSAVWYDAFKRWRQKPWGGILRGSREWEKRDRRLAWRLYEERIKGRTIRHQDNAILRGELLAARRKLSVDGYVDIHEGRRRHRHLDVAESVAACCLLAHQQQVYGRKLGMADIVNATSKSVAQEIMSKARGVTADLSSGGFQF